MLPCRIKYPTACRDHRSSFSMKPDDWIEAEENYNLPKAKNGKQPQCPQEKAIMLRWNFLRWCDRCTDKIHIFEKEVIFWI